MNVSRALLFQGDGHGAMGGNVDGTAIEVSMLVRFQVQDRLAA
jgi:acetamidase/formamidase